MEHDATLKGFVVIHVGRGVRAGPGERCSPRCAAGFATRSTLNESAGRRALQWAAKAQVDEHLSTDRRGPHGAAIRLRFARSLPPVAGSCFAAAVGPPPSPCSPCVPDSADRGPDTAIQPDLRA